MWTLYSFGITLLLLLDYQETHARILPRTGPRTTPIEPVKPSTQDKYDFLDQISASKLECLLQFVEQPDSKLQCIDKLFGDERSQFLLDELRVELAGFAPQEGMTIGATEDKDHDNVHGDVDELVADLNTLSGKANPLSTVNDDIPIINSNKAKRVEEQVDTPKKEEQRDAEGYINPQVTAEVVKSDIVDNDDNRNKIDTDADDGEDGYEYDTSLVSKLYNMLQDLVIKETFDYGLDMAGDDDDSDEGIKEPGNLIQNTVATELNINKQDESDSEEEDEGKLQYANELNTSDNDDEDEEDDDEIEKELKQMHGAPTHQIDDENDDDDDADDSDEEKDMNAIENDLVMELDKMLAMAKQAAAARGQTSDEIIPSDKFLQDLRQMEKSLKESSD